jgi:hypothetical protein
VGSRRPSLWQSGCFSTHLVDFPKKQQLVVAAPPSPAKLAWCRHARRLHSDSAIPMAERPSSASAASTAAPDSAASAGGGRAPKFLMRRGLRAPFRLRLHRPPHLTSPPTPAAAAAPRPSSARLPVESITRSSAKPAMPPIGPCRRITNSVGGSCDRLAAMVDGSDEILSFSHVCM